MEISNFEDVLDFYGLLFIHFPDDLSFDECRERLELEIVDAALSMGEDVEGEESSVSLSPAWINTALTMRYWKETDNLDKETYAKEVASAWEQRKLRQLAWQKERH